MSKSYPLSFIRSKAPIDKLVTKFGGQPVWYSEPQWPVSRATGTQMMFLGQVVLDRHVFGDPAAAVAYLFLTDDTSGKLATMDPDGGENAVVLQPGRFTGLSMPLATGPTLMGRCGLLNRRFEPVEYAVRLVQSTDDHLSPSPGTRIGGPPAWIVEPDLPRDDSWRLLIQLEPNSPIELGLGDAGVLYAMVNQAGTRGIMLWQSH